MKPKDAIIQINKISFKDLRRQKLALIEMIPRKGISLNEAEALEGILSLIDAIQDYAIDSGQLTHMQVFGKNYGRSEGEYEK